MNVIIQFLSFYNCQREINVFKKFAIDFNGRYITRMTC